ncbi:hypothetical protein GD627_08420 [Arthrobacter yangruifuii]|uniref:Lipoprotein n=1 Tax=Arthrobacter yangruifuii TaxID=2606616 RepID=A0A5N6MGP5_9MICC|nr:hypothetical protein [Arthrobacter yangruifuii]KAD3632874.1 hypothetical protein GD627_08420 [Arthrobacter yangruifuii]
MGPSPKSSTRAQTGVLAALILFGGVGAGCGGTSTLGAVRNSADEAARAIYAAAEPAELNGARSSLDNLLRQTDRSGLSVQERAIVDAAAQRSAALQQIVKGIPESDSFTFLLSRDAVMLVQSFRTNAPHSPAFQTIIDGAAERVLRHTACSVFSAVMNRDATDRAQARKLLAASPYGTAGRDGVGDWLATALDQAGTSVGEMNRYVDLSGLSSGILTASQGYVGKLQNLMDAAAWSNGGAIYLYVRHCV